MPIGTGEVKHDDEMYVITSIQCDISPGGRRDIGVRGAQSSPINWAEQWDARHEVKTSD